MLKFLPDSNLLFLALMVELLQDQQLPIVYQVKMAMIDTQVQFMMQCSPLQPPTSAVINYSASEK